MGGFLIGLLLVVVMAIAGVWGASSEILSTIGIIAGLPIAAFLGFKLLT